MLPEPSVEQSVLWDSMEEYLNEEIIEAETKFQAVPDKLKTRSASIQTSENVKKIGEKHRLQEETIRKLSYTTGMILLGEVNIVDFVETLQKECGLTEEPARKLARDINQAIFLPVKESLKKIHKVPAWPREEETPSPEPATPRVEGNIVNLKEEE